MFPDSIPNLIERRFKALQPEVMYGSIDFSTLKEFSGKLSMAWATSILKTWANAWTTSSRMHETVVRDCLFGCRPARADLRHYLRCPVLWGLLCGEEEDLNSTMAERLMFINPEPGKAMKIVVAFLAYHALKNDPHQLPERAVRAAWDQAVSTTAQRP